MENDKLVRNYDRYFYSKCIWAIAYCDNPAEMINNLFSKFNINYDNFCDMLDIFLGYNYDCVDPVSKNNLACLINHLYSVPNVSNRQGFYNRFKGLLNRCDTSRVRGLILSEYELRYMFQNVPSSIVAPENIDKYFSMLKCLFVNDLDIFISHLYSDSNSFNKCIDSYIHNSLNYIGSINKIISDCPDIVKNVTFSSRVHHVCNIMENGVNDSYVKKIYNSFRSKLS